MSLKSLAAPTVSPTTDILPSGSRVRDAIVDWAVETALGDPATMIARVPAAARVEPPETGESTSWDQDEIHSIGNDVVWVGEEEEGQEKEKMVKKVNGYSRPDRG